MTQRNDLLARIRDSKALIEGLEQSGRTAKTPAQRTSAKLEIARQKQTIENLRFQWESLNLSQKCPV